ncbi:MULTISPECIES: hypothetical protein [unclassified Leeuwenhoekiella]|uniref:hypothetical protein n=1 Tax=unclassified Leeuwenhoekiella TaxID=2615029 RepID=UPI000C49EF24|nr:MULTISPECIES: hypothetical protein [unclassified Leeuwenhoekiella]MAW94955.1 hypothetical protein [Leeuwenhoekiella sp.]MBA79675.1 hypothetical protein [Leeuwenhoekiella sp.]|tara:strand:- start:32051 stop:32743 length:693 start_codon:yes stop_codon:yes gene_type:complete
MIFRKRKFKRNVQKLEKSLVDKLGSQFPNLKENSKNWELASCNYFNHQEKFILLLHQINPEVLLKIKAKITSDKYEVKGIQIFNTKSNKSIEIILVITNDLIQQIKIDLDNNPLRALDFNKIEIDNILIEKIKIENTDIQIVRRILKNITKEESNYFDFNNTIEIEIENLFLYTVIDMQDGNYIAVDKKGQVYRLIHDHEKRAKRIANDISIFLSNYSGDKKDLENYFEY